MAAERDGVDDAALAALRPGDPEAALRAALGPRWRPPAPHAQGLVDIVKNSHRFRARLDIDGVIAEVEYRDGFAPDIPIDRLRFGMSVDAVRAVFPNMIFAAPVPNLVSGHLDLTPRVRFICSFPFGELKTIRYWDREARYPPKQPVAYPAPSGPPGWPFADPNLKLAVLSELIDAKVIDLGSPPDLFSHVLGRPFDEANDGYDLVQGAYDYLVRFPLNDEHLAAVTELTTDGGSTIYRYAYYFWGGEQSLFEIKSFAGLDRCPNLKSIHIISMVETVDFDHLRGLRNLESLRIGAASHLLHPEAILDLPSLKTVDRFMNAPDLFDALTRRGVELRRSSRIWK